MYHVVMGVASDDDQLQDKVDAISDLADAGASIRVTLVHVYDGEGDVEDVPAVAEGLELLEAAGVEATVHDPVDESPRRGVVDAAAHLDADVICIGGRHRSPAGKLQMKTGSQEIVLRAGCPVLVAGEVESQEPRA